MTEAQQDQQILKQTPSCEQRDRSTSSPPRQIFRAHALQHYMQKNEKSVLPQTISPFAFICCWIVLALTILVSFFIWSIPVPNCLDTLGMPILQRSSASTTQTTSILAFFPLSAQAYIRSGQTVQVSSPMLESPLIGRVTDVDPEHLNVAELSKRYELTPALVQFLPTRKVFVGTITTSRAIPLQSDTSSRVIVRYQQGTRRALSLLLDQSHP
jgi:hypothetical protein